jgi:hypothetical protein
MKEATWDGRRKYCHHRQQLPLSSFHIGPHPIKSLYSGMQAPVAPCNSLPNGEKRENFNLIPSELTSTMAKRAALGESCTRSEGSGLLNCPKACLRQARMQQTAALNTFIRSEKLRTSLSYNQRIWWRTSACSLRIFTNARLSPGVTISKGCRVSSCTLRFFAEEPEIR